MSTFSPLLYSASFKLSPGNFVLLHQDNCLWKSFSAYSEDFCYYLVLYKCNSRLFIFWVEPVISVAQCAPTVSLLLSFWDYGRWCFSNNQKMALLSYSVYLYKHNLLNHTSLQKFGVPPDKDMYKAGKKIHVNSHIEYSNI